MSETSLTSIPDSIDPEGLHLLDLAALQYFPVVRFTEDEQASGVTLCRAVGPSHVVRRLRALGTSGLIALSADSGGTPEPDSRWGDLEAAVRGQLARRSMTYGLTGIGGAVWERYRRPMWDRRLRWLTRPGSVTCYGTSEYHVRDAVERLRLMCGLSRYTYATPIEGVRNWRHTYWRRGEDAFRLEQDAPPTVSRVQWDAVLWALSSAHIFDIEGVARRGRADRPPWVGWRSAT